jgi:glycosyltransferase involved in cell wall biosynthesis
VVSLSIFFPCHNEEDHVERTTRRALEVGREIGVDFEVIVVDDGSTDRTHEIAERLAAEEAAVRVVRHERNLGYGAALRTGFESATKEWVFYTGGDGQFDIGELPDLVSLTADFDVISCFRIRRRDPWLRRLNSIAWNSLVNILFNLRIRDVNCAFKLVRREVFGRIEMSSQGALIDTEILARAHRMGYRITQRGVQHYARTSGIQSGAAPKVILKAFGELFKLRRRILSDSK